MSSANSFLPSTTYHTANTRYSTSQTSSSSSSSSSSSYNIRSNSVQQQLNDLNSTRSSTSTCSTSHCLSNQCLECTTILSTRPSQSRCNLNSYIDSSASTNSSHFVQNCSYVTNSTIDNHSQISTLDDQQSTRILSMNIPVDNSNNQSNELSINSTTLNIEIEEEDDDDEQQQTVLCNEHLDQNEQLEVFVGFYRPGEYQRETNEDEDDEEDEHKSDTSSKSDAQKKEQSTRELISDDDEGNEDQDFIDEDFGPNQDDDTDQIQTDNEITNEEPLNPNIFDNDQQQLQQIEANEPILFPIVIVQIDEDEDQGFGAQFNDDCQSSDDENNHVSTISLNNNHSSENELVYSKKKFLQRSQSYTDSSHKTLTKFHSLPSLSMNCNNDFEKVEHIIIDDQQPLTTMSNFLIHKKQNNDEDYSVLRKKRLLRKSSEEIIEISNQETPLQTIVVETVRDVERHVMLWNDDHAREINDQSSLQQIVQYFQLNIDIDYDQHSQVSSIRRELLLDYLQYRSETDISASDLCENLRQYSEYSSRIHCRFFSFWPPRDVDLLQWLSYWLKQDALPVAIMNMDHSQSHKFNLNNNNNNINNNNSIISSWQHRIIYGVDPRGIYLMNPMQIQSPQQVYEQLTVDSITYISRHEIIQRYNQSPMSLTPLAKSNNPSKLFSDTRWRSMNVLGQVVNVLREDRQLHENETRNIPYRPTVTHVRIPSTCSSGMLIFSKDYNQLFDAIDLPLRQ
ncbi:hypothetical protein I4U23_007203 [Adineta vaga]|nr:hypothetical protein I4U23_007203 [Adineta vaga]